MKFPKIQRHHIHHGGLILGGIVAAVVFFAIGVILRLLIGPVSLAPFSTQLSDSISRSLPGISVKFDEAALEWSRDKRRVDVVILGARVYDSKNRIVAQAPKAAIDLKAAPFFRGQIAVQRITLIGVQLTMVRCTDGVLRLGVEGGRATSDVLQRLTDDIAKSNNSTMSLKSFAVRDARIAFYGEASGLFVVAPKANLSVTNTGKKGAAQLQANVDASIEISGHRSHFVAALTLPRANGPAVGHFTVSGFNLRGLGLNAPAFAALKNADLAIDMSGDFSLQHGTRLQSANLDVNANGVVNDPRFPGGPLHVKSLHARMRYDGGAGRVFIEDASLDSDHASAHLSGQGTVQVNAEGLLTRVDANLTADRMLLDIPGFLPKPVSFKRVVLRAGYVPSTGEMDFEHIGIQGGPLLVDVSGNIVFAENMTPAINIQGTIGAIGVRDLLDYWPEDMAAGAREWIDENMPAGHLGPVVLKTQIPLGALSGTALPETDVNLAFPISGASATYVKGLTPITNGQGSALLTGDTFKLDLNSGNVGSLAISNGHVIIPNLHESAPVGDMSAHVEGAVPDMLALIDMKPLQYPSHFGIDPANTKGTASVDLDFHVPMVNGESIDQIGISVKAALSDLAVSLGPGTQISNGVANLTVDNKAVHAVGTVELAGAKVGLDWTETFNPAGPYSTDLAVKTVLDENARAAMGFDASDFISGPVGVTANLQGAHGKILRGKIALDLTPTTISVDLIDYTKAAGVPASAQLDAQFESDGAMSAEDLRIAGTGLLVTGSAGFDKDGKITSLDLPQVRAGSLNDFSLKLVRTPAAGLNVTINGPQYDAARLIGHPDRTPEKSKAAAPPSQEPFHITAQIGTVSLHKGVTLSPFAFTVSGVGESPETMSLNTTLPKNQKLTASLVSGADGRKLSVETPDAGTLIKGLFDFDSMKGGALVASATMPPAAAATPPPATPATASDPPPQAGPPDFEGSVTIKDFKITNQPFLVRLFSAGSLDGILNLLQEQGIEFDRMVVPFSSKNGMMTIKDARAAGPSLGVTAEGYIDRTRNQVSVGGTLAPIYGINSLLGAIPIVGNVLVSKQGEGLVGMTYNVSGDASEPDVSVNPLSILTPGIFRRIFEGTHVPPPPLESSSTTPAPPAPAPKPGG